MRDQDVTQGLSVEAGAVLGGIQTGNDRLAKLNAAVEDMAAHHADQRAHDKAVSRARDAFVKYHAKFGWTEAQFAGYWPLRDRPRAPGEKQSEWHRLLNREEKRVKAAGKPRKNSRPMDMAPEDAATHRRKQVKDAVGRHRAKMTAAAATNAAATGERLLTDEELSLIAAAEASQAPLAVEDQDMAALLASLKAAEEAEGA